MTGEVVLLDTGPLVSFLAAGVRHHKWAIDQWRRLRPPLLTCEAVLTESAFLLKREGADSAVIFELMERGALKVAFSLEKERARVRVLMARYKNRPMSLADACLVRLSELHPDARVFTLESDFRVYRRDRNRAIPLIMPNRDE